MGKRINVNDPYEYEPAFLLPKELMHSKKYKGLSSGAKVLFSILLTRCMDSGGNTTTLKRDDAADILSVCGNTVTKLFKELNRFGLIIEHERGMGIPNLITVRLF